MARARTGEVVEDAPGVGDVAQGARANDDARIFDVDDPVGKAKFRVLEFRFARLDEMLLLENRPTDTLRVIQEGSHLPIGAPQTPSEIGHPQTPLPADDPEKGSQKRPIVFLVRHDEPVPFIHGVASDDGTGRRLDVREDVVGGVALATCGSVLPTAERPLVPDSGGANDVENRTLRERRETHMD